MQGSVGKLLTAVSVLTSVFEKMLLIIEECEMTFVKSTLLFLYWVSTRASVIHNGMKCANISKEAQLVITL